MNEKVFLDINFAMERGHMPYIFGYGSLVDRDQIKAYAPNSSDISYCVLKGFKRVFNVAMDNQEHIEGYKFYIDDKGNRPNVCVTFLNIQEADGVNILGSLFRVPESMLEMLDKRERNYNRVKINDQLDTILDEDAFVYIAKLESVQRFFQGQRDNRSVVTKNYKNIVEKAYEKIHALDHYMETTSTIDVPIKDYRLKRISR